MENRKRFKFAAVIFVFIIALLYFTHPRINPYGLGILNLADNYMHGAYIGRRNPLKIPSATFYKNLNNDSLYVKFEDFLLPMYDWDWCFIDSMVVEACSMDNFIKYEYRPEFYQDKFMYYFESVDAKILSGDPNHLDYQSIQSGIYELNLLTFDKLNIKSLKEFWDRVDTHFKDNPHLNKLEACWQIINVEMYEILYTLRGNLVKVFTKSTEVIPEIYSPEKRVYFRYPLLYCPFPLSDKAYIFPAERLCDFNYITDFVHDQNFYATLANIPPDIRRLGKVVALDKNGVLLSLEREKTPNMKVYMQRIQDDELYYASFVNYRKTHKKELINDDEYQMILEHSDKVDKSYALYDKEIFVNLRKMLSFLDYEELSEKHGC